MKWPTQFVLIRHTESQYNTLKGVKMKDLLYRRFIQEYEKNHRSPTARRLATKIMKRYALGVSDAETGITYHGGVAMARKTGAALKPYLGAVPDVIFVSPYKRTQETLACMQSGWPELAAVRVVHDDRIREQEHGRLLVYNDWRVFHVMDPEQKTLRDIQGPYWYQYPQGESVSQVCDRVRSFLSMIVREYAEQRVMLITHHLTILSIRALLERHPPEEFIRIDEHEKPLNCGVTVYRGNPALGSDGRLVLEQYNQRFC